MTSFPVAVWFLLGLIAAAAVLALIRAISGTVGNEIAMRETKAKAAKLRAHYEEQSRERSGRDILIVHESQSNEAQRRAA